MAASVTFLTEPDDSGRDLFTPTMRLRDTKAGRETLRAAGRAPAYLDRRTTSHRTKSAQKRDETKWERREFIAWDGEGVDVAGRHRYVILANSLGDSIVDPGGIKTQDAFNMMFRASDKHPKAINVVFAGGYDVNMILRGSITRGHARRLADVGYVDVRIGDIRYRVRYHPRHEFSVSEVEWDESKRRLQRKHSFTLWDVFGSFQSSFVVACKRLLDGDDLAELDHITRMKAERGNFRLDDMDDMLAYCRAELRALVRLAETDRDNFDSAGFKATRFDGAGAKASAVLRQKEVIKHKAETPPELSNAVRGAYAGGRIEGYRFGYYEGPVWTVDIRSAYPWAATYLPSLADGTWEHILPPDMGKQRSTGAGTVGRQSSDMGEHRRIGPSHPDEFSLWHVSYSPTAVDGLHPLYWRGPAGNICYPCETSGWYWAPEVWASRAAHGRRLQIDEGWVFTPATDHRPFDFVPELFRIRARLEKTHKGRGQALKLALNSLYGKLAQQIGSKDGKPPRWHQLEWAGWITSKTRATVYDIARQRVDNLVDIATDGVCFYGSEPDAELLAQEGTDLGQLEIVRYDAGVWVQSGVYWLHDPDKGWIEPKVRGVGAPEPCKACGAGAEIACDHRRPLARTRFLAEWEGGGFGAVPVDVTRFRGLVTSSISDERWREWCQWIAEPRDIAAGARGKRIHIPEDCAYCRRGGSIVDGSDLHSTLAIGGGTESALHVLEWESSIGRTTANTAWLDTLDEDDAEAE